MQVTIASIFFRQEKFGSNQREILSLKLIKQSAPCFHRNRQLLEVANPTPKHEINSTDGSEFARHFHDTAGRLNLTHYHMYPRTPKMNAHIERFNRTIQEEFADYHRPLLLNPEVFNEKLMEWLIFYNTKRVHHAFENTLTPLQYLLQYEATLPMDCKSTLGRTVR